MFRLLAFHLWSFYPFANQFHDFFRFLLTKKNRILSLPKDELARLFTLEDPEFTECLVSMCWAQKKKKQEFFFPSSASKLRFNLVGIHQAPSDHGSPPYARAEGLPEDMVPETFKTMAPFSPFLYNINSFSCFSIYGQDKFGKPDSTDLTEEAKRNSQELLELLQFSNSEGLLEAVSIKGEALDDKEGVENVLRLLEVCSRGKIFSFFSKFKQEFYSYKESPMSPLFFDLSPWFMTFPDPSPVSCFVSAHFERRILFYYFSQDSLSSVDWHSNQSLSDLFNLMTPNQKKIVKAFLNLSSNSSFKRLRRSRLRKKLRMPSRL